jgi:hypothetical protein
MTRHRQQQFKSLFTPEEIVLDPEKGLWVPGRKTICIPAPKMPAIGIDWSWPYLSAAQEAFFSRRRDSWGRWDKGEPVCVPSRDQLFVPVRYRDIQRSTRPAWRNGSW